MGIHKPIMFVMRGLHASGKTEKAAELLGLVPGLIRLSRSDFREMIRKGQPWDLKEEKKVVAMFMEMLRNLLLDNHSVLIDDLNLNEQTVRLYQKYAEFYEYDFRLVNLNTPIDRCLAYDFNRRNPVGRDAIINLAAKHGLYKQENTYVIYTLDGTIADNTSRINLSRVDGDVDLSIYYDANTLATDTVIRDGYDQMLMDLEAGYEIFIFAQRPEKARDATEIWLNRHKIPYNRLFMRADDDIRTDDLVMDEIYNTCCDKDLCLHVVDSNTENHDMWTSNGIMIIDLTSKAGLQNV